MKTEQIKFTAPEDGILKIFGNPRSIEMKKGETITFDPFPGTSPKKVRPSK